VNFDTFLEDQLEVDCQAIRLDETSLKMTEDLNERMHIIPQSVAIGMRAVTATGRNAQKYSQINLRKGEFAYVQNYESILKTGMEAFKLVAVIMLLFAVSYVGQYLFYTAKTNELNQKYEKQFVSLFKGQKTSVARRSANFRGLRKYVNDYFDSQTKNKRKSIEDFVKENSGSVPLITLRAVSEAIPKELTIDVVRFHVTSKDAKPGVSDLIIKGHAPDYNTVDEVVDKMKQHELLRNTEKKSATELPGSKEKKKQFEVQLKEYSVM